MVVLKTTPSFSSPAAPSPSSRSGRPLPAAAAAAGWRSAGERARARAHACETATENRCTRAPRLVGTKAAYDYALGWAWSRAIPSFCTVIGCH